MSVKVSIHCTARALVFLALTLALPLSAQQATPADPSMSTDNTSVAQVISPEARGVLDRMTAYLRTLQTFSIATNSSRDEILAFGYKLQNIEHGELVVQRPNKLRAEIDGDIRTRTIVYDGTKLAMYSPDDAAYVRIDAPDTLAKLIGGLLDAGVEMPLMDVLYQAAAGTLTEAVRTGILVGDSMVDGVDCDHLAFRQANIDWQLWVEKGERTLPRKILVTTRYVVGDPQFQAVLTWNLKPKINKSTFVFTAPKDAVEVPFSDPVAIQSGAP
jgi:hypothetical protein